jgi:hypothetical protein
LYTACRSKGEEEREGGEGERQISSVIIFSFSPSLSTPGAMRAEEAEKDRGGDVREGAGYYGDEVWRASERPGI